MSVVRRLLQALAVLPLLVAPAALSAQGGGAASAAGGERPVGDRLRVFLDCQPFVPACRGDYFVVELPFVSWTRDRLFADAHLLVTSLESGNGGREFTITVLGQQRFAGERDTLTVRTLPEESEDNVRRVLADAFRTGLYPFARRTPAGERLRVVYDAPEGEQPATSTTLADPWNLWVIESNLGGFANGESLARQFNVFYRLSGRRVTERWRLQLGGRGEYQDLLFRIPDAPAGQQERRNIRRNAGVGSRIVRSLDDHWSAGLLLNAGRSDFTNIRLSMRAAPVVEYNVFPWRDATRRQLLLAYGVGPVRLRYLEPTIYGQTLETRFLHHLQAGVESRLSWGSTDAEVRATQFLHDPRLYRITADASAELRVAKGLSLRLGVNASKIADQIFLAARGVTDDQVLLSQRARATRYQYGGFVSVNYTFGSIYNTIVNPRMEDFRFGPDNFF